MIGLEDFNFQSTRWHFLLEDGLCVEGAVIITDTGMVTANNQMAATAVLAKYRMQNGFTGTGVQHVKTVTGNHHGVGREIHFHHFANGGITHVGRNITRFQLAQQHMNQDTVSVQCFLGHAAQFFVGAMHRVTGLESDYIIPATLNKLIADGYRGAEGIGEVVSKVGVVQYLDVAGNDKVACGQEIGHARVLLVVGGKNLLGHCFQFCVRRFFDGGYIHHGNHRLTIHIGVAQGNTLGTGDGADIL